MFSEVLADVAGLGDEALPAELRRLEGAWRELEARPDGTEIC